jgi:hypothetical protein
MIAFLKLIFISQGGYFSLLAIKNCRLTNRTILIDMHK